MDRSVHVRTDPARLRRVWGVGVLLWIGMCAYVLAHELENPRILGIAVCVLLIIAPAVVGSVAKLPVYLLAGYAALVPFDELLVTGTGATLTKIVAIVTGGALLLSMIAMRRTVRPPRAFALVVALMLFSGATIFWAIDPRRAMSAFTNEADYFLLFAVICLYPVDAADLRVILGGAVAGALLAAIYGIVLFHSGDQFDGARVYIARGDQYVVDPNEFAAAMLVPMAITLVMFLRTRLSPAKLAWLVPLSIFSSGIAVSGSRGGAIALGVMCVYLFFRSRYKAQILAAAVLLVTAVLSSPVGARFAQADVTDLGGRADIWKVGIASLHRYWLAGSGVGDFTPAFAQFFLSTPHLEIPWDRVAHSILIQSAVETGIVGFVLLMALWYSVFRELAGVRVTNPLVADLCIALQAGVLGIFVAGISLSLMTAKFTWLGFSLVVLMRSMLLTSTPSQGRAPARIVPQERPA